MLQDYVEGLRRELEELGDDESAPSYDARYDRITELVKEISLLQLCFCQVGHQAVLEVPICTSLLDC